ncbi:rND transporter HAE1/HME family permease protein [Roseburia sp. CAG:309]|nr:rND transporter HAE1/HME family permease protein [Roseburia sp. CAG:309]
MLSKLSVRKPYTVLVAVVLVIVLGILSFSNMSTDLMPDMEFPYAIVMTTYPGASPEEIETAVTKPVEQAMASITNMKQVSSVSNSNMSVVILEFNENTDMNSATIDMRESLDTVSAQWDDSIGNPTIMKINPDMMPIMVAALDYDNMDSVGVTEKAENDIIPELESVEGVASVSASGEVDKKIEVIIQEDKIKEMNRKVQDAIDGKLQDASDKIEKNKNKIQDGKDTLSDKQDQAADKLAKGEAKLNQSSEKMKKTLETINANLKTIESKEKELKTAEKQLKTGLAQISTQKASLQATIKTLTATKTSLTQLQTSLSALTEQKQALETQIAAVGENAELKSQLDAVNTQLTVMQQKLTEQGMTQDDLPGKITEVDAGLTKAQEGMQTITAQEKKLAASKKQLKSGKKKIAAGKAKLLDAKDKLEKGQISVEEAKNEISKQKVLVAIKLSVAEVQVNTGESKLDEAEKQLKDSKKTTKEGADLKKIITKSMVENILKAENFDMPAGYITDNEASYLVKVGEKVENQKDIENLVICDMGFDDLDPIRLSDVADIAVTDNSEDVYTMVNGNPAVALTMEKATGYSTGDVTKRLESRLDQLEKDNEGLHTTVLMNQGLYIDLVVNSVVDNLLYGALFSIIILLLFLKDLRPTFIVACSIPLSVVAAVVLMYFSGVTLNVISLSGLALGVGMLVDNSVVVIENIFRLRNEEGYSIKEASIEGAKQVGGAILASTLTTICVFAPIVFTEGITRQLFTDLALTLAYSLLASLVVALTLVPAMSQGMLRKVKDNPNKLIIKIQNLYGKVLSVLLHKKIFVLLGALVLLVAFALLSVSRGTAFMPEMRSTQMTATISIPKDDDTMSKQDLYEKSNEVMDQFLKVDGVETVGAMSGGGGMMSMMSGGSDSISVYMLLNEDNKRSNQDIKKEMEEKVKDIPCDVSIEASAMDMSSMFGSGITMRIKGKDLDKLQKISEGIMKQLDGVEGITEITNGMEDASQEFRITVKKDKAMEYSLTVAQVFQQINARVKDASSATTLSTDTEDLDVYVSDEKDEKLKRSDIEKMKIEYTDSQTQKTKKVKLSKIADFSMADTPSSINRINQTRYMTVSLTLGDDYNVGLVSNDVHAVLDKYEMPSGYELEFTGEDETINESIKQVALMFIVGVIFMYLIMVAQFQSLLSPFIILFTIPLAFTGGFMGLWISGSEVSVIALIGFVMLSGIIVNNGIVLVDYINQLRERGMTKYEAIVEAGKTRLRPILMTALTTILGLLPMIISSDSGSDMIRPMSIVTIGGLIYGTLLTLFVVPCIYAILNRKKDRAMQEEIEKKSEK